MKNIFGWLTQNQAWQKIGYLAVLGIAVYLILPQITALENSWQVLTSMTLWAVGLAFIAQILSYLGSGFLLQSILAIAHQKVSLWLNTLIVLGSYSIGMVAGGMIGSHGGDLSLDKRRQGQHGGRNTGQYFFASVQQHHAGTGLYFWVGSSDPGSQPDTSPVDRVRSDPADPGAYHRRHSPGGALPEPGY